MATQEDTLTPSFTTVPILPLSQARDPTTKPAFLKDLCDTLLNVGFLYISDTGLPEDLVKRVCELTKEFFDENVLPLEVKERIEMKNEKSFLGWSRVGFPFRLQVPQNCRQQLSVPEDVHNILFS
jgi:isopenicillin N synthase-like dioxygenase